MATGGRVDGRGTLSEAVVLALGAALVLTVLAYWPILWSPPVYEDFNWWPTLQPRHVTWHQGLTWMSLWLNGPSPFWMHVTNVGLHLANGLLVWGVAVALIGPPGATLATVLFLWHPLQTEAVAYISGRSEVLGATCVLSACALASRGWSWWRTPLVLAFLAAGIYAKPSSVVGLALVPLVAWYLETPGWGGWLWLMAVPVVYSFSHLKYLAVSGYGDWPTPSFVGGQLLALMTYLRMVVWPVGQSVDHDWSAVDPWVIVGMVLFLFILVSHAQMDSRRRLWKFVGLWLLLSLLPRLLITIPETLFEHQTYLPFVGIWIGLAAVVLPSPHESGSHS